MKHYGLLGKQISYSLSPLMHGIVFKTLSIDADYELIDGELPEMLSRLKELDGFNITIPFKQDIMPYLQSIDPSAKRIGAVNTVVRDEQGWHGFNTDYYGVIETVKGLKLKQLKRAIILGTGGAAKAVFYALRDLGVEDIRVISRTASSQFEGVRCTTYEVLESEGIESDLLVNCTPIGTFGKAEASLSPVSAKIVAKQGGIIDLIYNPEKTPLLMLAEGQGLPNSNGLKMLIVQAIYAEKLWQKGLAIDIQFMYDKINETLMKK